MCDELKELKNSIIIKLEIKWLGNALKNLN